MTTPKPTPMTEEEIASLTKKHHGCPAKKHAEGFHCNCHGATEFNAYPGRRCTIASLLATIAARDERIKELERLLPRCGYNGGIDPLLCAPGALVQGPCQTRNGVWWGTRGARFIEDYDMKLKVVPDPDGKYFNVEVWNNSVLACTVEGFDSQGVAQVFIIQFLGHLATKKG